MRPSTLLVITLALAFGGVAAGGVYLFSSGESATSGPKSTIVVAKADIPRGASITAESVVAKECPKELISGGMLTKVEDAIGRPALTSLFKEEPILDAKLGAKGTGGGLASLLKHGMRAVTIPTTSGSQTNHIATFIEVGSHVDIHWTPPDTGRDPNAAPPENIPLLENVEVIAVDDKLDSATAAKADGATIKSVTVQLKPEDAATLAPALTRGAIHLSMRNPTDDGRAPRRPVVAKPAPRREVAEAPKPAPAPPAPLTIRTLRGTREGVIRLGPAFGSAPAAVPSPPAPAPSASTVMELGRDGMKRFSPFGAPPAATAK